VRIARPHGDEHSEMSAARLAREADEVRSGLERTRTELRPAQRIVDVLHGGWIGVLVPRAEIECNRHDAVRCHGLVT